MWRFVGIDPAVRWRGVGAAGATPPAPWPMRHEAFITACAMHAASHERIMADIAKAFAKGKPEADGEKR